MYTRTDALLTIDHITMQYGPKVILKDVCAQIDDISVDGVERGQVVCFLGPSGCGKSTLSRIIAALLKPTSGSVKLVGGKITAASALAEPREQMLTRVGEVGMVPQNYILFEYLTVLENLRLAAKQGASTRVDGDVGDLGQALGLLGQMQQYPKQLSGGQRQRVAIARQLLCSSNYLVMDEPFSGQDPLLKSRTTRLIQQIAAQSNITIIIVTHDVTEGMSCADMVWLMGNPDGSGARIVDTIDLAAMGLAWREDILHDPKFQQVVVDIKGRFSELVPNGGKS